MDLLTDILQQSGLRRRLLDLRELTPAVALRFPCGRSIGLHVVTRGHVFVHAPTLPQPLVLQAGDIAVMARGCTHLLSLHAQPDAVPVEPLAVAGTRPGPADDAPSLRRRSRAAEEATPPAAQTTAVISGAYQLWHDPLHPLFAELPPWFVLRAAELPRLGALPLTVGLLDEEVQRGALGTEIIVHGLLDVVFTLLLREMVARLGHEGSGWSHAVRDLAVRRAVTLMHADCAHPWTLDELAQRSGLARTTLAERFRAAMDDTPLNYLRTLRMQKAMRLLGDTEHTLEQVAAEVGYQDAFGFSKVFKRTTGIAPREFRRRENEDDGNGWRFEAG